MTLTEEQQHFVDKFTIAVEIHELASAAGKMQIKMCLNGYAGTGKSVVIDHLIKTFPHIRFKVITFTNSAVNVLIAKGVHKPSTIHKFLYTLDDEQFDKKAGKSTLKFKMNRLSVKQRIAMKIDVKDEDEFDWIIVDEASTISPQIKADLESLGVSLLVVGDICQLPSVGEGNQPSIISPIYSDEDYIRVNFVNTRRFDGDILSLSVDVREGRKIPYHVSRDTAKYQQLPNENVLLVADVIIVGTNKLKVAVNNKVRQLKYNINNPNHPPFINEQLIVLKNNSSYKIVNSDILEFIDDEFNIPSLNEINTTNHPSTKIKDVNGKEFYAKLVFVDYLDPDTLAKFRSFCYNTYHPKGKTFNGEDNPFIEVGFSKCITAHKSQGNEYDKVLVFDQSFIFKGIEMEWLYTAITRAKKKLIIVDRMF